MSRIASHTCATLALTVISFCRDAICLSPVSIHGQDRGAARDSRSSGVNDDLSVVLAKVFERHGALAKLNAGAFGGRISWRKLRWKKRP